jgi:ribosomal protein S27AE
MAQYNDQPPQPTRVVCVRCGYDLSASMVGGFCPECGTAIEQSIRRQTASAGSSGTAITCMVLGIVSLAACGLLGPVAIALYYKARNEIDAG